MVLFLFVFMLMNLNADTEPQKNRWLKIAGVVTGGALLLVLVAALKEADLKTQVAEMGRGDIGLIHNLGWCCSMITWFRSRSRACCF